MAINPNNQDYIASPLNKALADKFLMVLNVPKALKNINLKFKRSNTNIQLETLQFSVWGSVIPQINVPAVDMRYLGGNFPISSHSRPPWSPVTVKFNIDSLWSNYWVIYQWLNLLRNERDGEYGEITDKQGILNKKNTVEDYSTNLTIYSVDEYQTPRVKWVYTYAFPTNLGEINFSERDTKQIECNFTFQFAQLLCELI